ncbi:hypothetical protein B296_00034988 [Ensete ventricosum]|uniref:Uncharacterized protein n=1 Tax=Ensete ventricosum TaxID=4639 RepID=A0A426Z5G8_ENSVE|nr:hypothetical protein B296_00034988 [Ensete ventricosum]
MGTGGYDLPVRGCRPRTALPPAGEAAPIAVVAATWQDDCPPQRAAAACAGAATTNYENTLDNFGNFEDCSLI